MLMTCKFDTPAQIEIRQLFSSGVGGSDPPSVDDADLEFLKTKEQIIQHLDIYKIPRETVEEVLHTYLGITLDELDGVGMDKMVYWDETDCYYYNGTGLPCADPFTITEGYHTPDGKIIIFYSIATLSKYKMTLIPVGDGYQAESNIWLNREQFGG